MLSNIEASRAPLRRSALTDSLVCGDKDSRSEPSTHSVMPPEFLTVAWRFNA